MLLSLAQQLTQLGHSCRSFMNSCLSGKILVVKLVIAKLGLFTARKQLKDLAQAICSIAHAIVGAHARRGKIVESLLRLAADALIEEP
ncbi:unnamed protein product [Periconia digitata]|uniref:Uncharacterized protein n=1 Tax=Periconia digitata TaxID=1303443 RepID=A0A9W4U691_9PLEO|nr:unnamed protein product [Periconia digitata]